MPIGDFMHTFPRSGYKTHMLLFRIGNTPSIGQAFETPFLFSGFETPFLFSGFETPFFFSGFETHSLIQDLETTLPDSGFKTTAPCSCFERDIPFIQDPDNIQLLHGECQILHSNMAGNDSLTFFVSMIYCTYKYSI